MGKREGFDTFKKNSDITTRKFSKRTLHSRDQFYDLEVTKTNNDISIEISSSQLTRGYIGGDKALIELFIKDLQAIIDL